MLRFLSVLVFGLLFAAAAQAGPEDPSKFDATPYPAQKALYDFNFAKPGQGKSALGYIRNHLRALKEFGDTPGSHIVIVAHGNELHAFSRHNREAYPEVYEALKELTDQGVSIFVCRNAARGRGYDSDDFYDVITVVPAAVSEITKWQNQGYSYMYAGFFPRILREELAK